MSNYNLPLFMAVDDGVLSKLSDQIISRNICSRSNKVYLLTTMELLNIFELELSELKNQFERLEIVIISGSSFDIAIQTAHRLISDGASILFGFGGGTVLDTAKYAAYISKIPYIAIPTTLSNDGLASPISVLSVDGNRKKSLGARIPKGLIIDTDILANTPVMLLQAGIGDTLSNYTALHDWVLDCGANGSRKNDFAYMLSELAFNALFYSSVKNLNSKQCIKMLAESLVLSGLAMEIAGNSRPCSGSEHLFSHALDELYGLNIPHGLQVALGSIVACMLQKRDYFMLLNYLKSYNISVNPITLGISKDQFVHAWEYAPQTRMDRYTILNEIEKSEAVFADIYNNLVEVCP